MPIPHVAARARNSHSLRRIDLEPPLLTHRSLFFLIFFPFEPPGLASPSWFAKYSQRNYKKMRFALVFFVRAWRFNLLARHGVILNLVDLLLPLRSSRRRPIGFVAQWFRKPACTLLFFNRVQTQTCIRTYTYPYEHIHAQLLLLPSAIDSLYAYPRCMQWCSSLPWYAGLEPRCLCLYALFCFLQQNTSLYYVVVHARKRESL